MSIFRKFMIFIGSGLIIIGVILAIVGFAFGGRLSINSCIIGHNSDDGTVQAGERINVTTAYEEVKSIVIDYRVGAIYIKEGDEFKIVAENVSKDRFESSVTDGVWTVSDKKGGAYSLFNHFNLGANDSTVTLYVPKNSRLTDCNFEIGAGKIDVDQLDTKNFTIKVGAGEVVVKNLTTEEATLDCGVGSIKVDGEIRGDSTIKCGIGAIALSLKGDPDDYNYNIKVGLGKTNINGTVYSGISDKQITHDNAAGTFKLDCGIGAIDLTIAP